MRTGVHEFQQVAKNVVAIIGITKVLSVLMGVERLVQFRSDGLGLSPGEYARLLGEIVATRGICTDDYSCGGVVAARRRTWDARRRSGRRYLDRNAGAAGGGAGV